MESAKSESRNASGQQEWVTFRLCSQVYALPLESIIQVVEMVTITPIPQVAPSVQGIINFHGAAIPVVNLRRHLELGSPDAPLDPHIILVQTSEHKVGLIVDQVSGMLNLSTEQVIRPAAILPQDLGEAAILQGVAHTPWGAALLLDLNRLLQPISIDLASIYALVQEVISSQVPPGRAEQNSQAMNSKPPSAPGG